MIGASPKLRFPEFREPWKPTSVGTLLEKKSDPVDVDLAQTYRQIGVRSHGKGIFHKEEVTGAALGEKRVFHVVPNALVVNIVFAWEQAVALTSDAEAGFVASHRFPMFTEKNGRSYLPFLRQMFLTKRGKLLLEMASPGGAGRNKTLGQQEFLKLKPVVPSRAEQERIADAIGAVDAKLSMQRAKQAALGRFKVGLMQKLFSQQLRFTKDDGQAFPDWQTKRLGDGVQLVSGQHLGPSEYSDIPNDTPYFTGPSDFTHDTRRLSKWVTGRAKLAKAGDVLLTVKGSGVGELWLLKFPNVAMGRQLMAIRGTAFRNDLIFHILSTRRNQFQALATGNMIPGLSRPDILQIKMNLPTHPDEQQKIADALSTMDAKIQAVADQVAKLEAFKKGLLQQMFV